MSNPDDFRWHAEALSTVTLVTGDLAGSRDFAARILGLRLLFEDAESAVFELGETMVNMLAAQAAPELFGPDAAPETGAGARVLLTLTVDDVDRVRGLVLDRGAREVGPAIDRPWGVRTVNVVDPGGHVWELAGPLRS